MKTILLLIMMSSPPRMDLPIPGVEIRLSTGQVTVSDSNGEYVVTVPNCWSGLIVPAKAGYVFTPVYREGICVEADVTADFSATKVKGKK